MTGIILELKRKKMQEFGPSHCEEREIEAVSELISPTRPTRRGEKREDILSVRRHEQHAQKFVTGAAAEQWPSFDKYSALPTNRPPSNRPGVRISNNHNAQLIEHNLLFCQFGLGLRAAIAVMQPRSADACNRPTQCFSSVLGGR